MEFEPIARRPFIRAILAMGAIVLSSNILVQFPLNDWLTWGAFTYPVAYLVIDLVNRRYGPVVSRKVAWAGFAVAVLASLLLAPPRIALASGTAYIASQLLDIQVFDRLRQGNWWRAPLVSTVLSATLDTALFWSIAFAGANLPWTSWAAGDLAVKLGIGITMLLPFRIMIRRRPFGN